MIATGLSRIENFITPTLNYQLALIWNVILNEIYKSHSVDTSAIPFTPVAYNSSKNNLAFPS